MVRDAALSIRITPELKKRLEDEAANAGTSLASYAERALGVHSAPPRWILSDVEVVHDGKGTTIKLRIAEGWPVALMPVAKAEELGTRLLEAVKTAKKIGK